MEEYVREWYGHRTRVLKMEEYVREWYGHRTRVFKMEEYVREWHGRHTRVFVTLTICSRVKFSQGSFKMSDMCISRYCLLPLNVVTAELYAC